MASDEVEINLNRFLASELLLLLNLNTAKDMFGKSYYALGIAEKNAVDNTVVGHVIEYYNQITPQMFQSAKSTTAGFQQAKADDSSGLPPKK